MISGNMNKSYRMLFFGGLSFDKPKGQEVNTQKAKPFGYGLEIVKECPCGCGLKENICEERAEKTDNEMPF
jgi:hypothetical protein